MPLFGILCPQTDKTREKGIKIYHTVLYLINFIEINIINHKDKFYM